MKKRRKEFKHALRSCSNAKEKCKEEALSSALHVPSIKRFRENIRNSNNKSTIPPTVGRATGNKLSQRGKVTLKPY